MHWLDTMVFFINPGRSTGWWMGCDVGYYGISFPKAISKKAICFERRLNDIFGKSMGHLLLYPPEYRIIRSRRDCSFSFENKKLNRKITVSHFAFHVVIKIVWGSITQQMIFGKYIFSVLFNFPFV